MNTPMKRKGMCVIGLGTKKNDYRGFRITQKQKRAEKHSSRAPILTNTTLTVLRQIGKYLQMSRLLKPIAYDIIVCMNQLFDYYLYAVHLFFTSDLVNLCPREMFQFLI